jgi:16S rRNA processing protein RimM
MLTVGVVAKAYGLGGEVVVRLLTDQTQRLDAGTVLSSARGPLTVVDARPYGERERYLVRFEGVDDRTSAERLHGVDLLAEPLDVPGALWVHELVGAAVRDVATGDEVGTVVAVEANPASDLLVLAGGALIPTRFVVSHDASSHAVEVDLPEGLLDL